MSKQPDPSRSPSSIPTPDEAREAAGTRSDELIDYWDLTDAGLSLESDDPNDVEHFVSPVIDEILTAAAPKLYAYWAKGQVPDFVVGFAYEDGTFRCRREPGRCVPGTTVLAGYEPPGAACSICHVDLAALGLEDAL